MKPINLFLFSVLTIGFVNSSYADESISPIVKNAQIDIARYEKQANDLTPARSSNARRILKLLKLSHQRLHKASNNKTESWKAVNKRYVSLESQLQTLLHSNKSSATPLVKKPSPNSAIVPPPNNKGGVRSLVSGERVRLTKMARDIASVADSLVIKGPSSLQDPKNIAARKKRLVQFQNALTRYPQLDDPDVKLARKAYQDLRQKLLTELNRAKEQLVELGNVQQRLAKLDANSKSYPLPKLLKIPFNEEDTKAWVKAGSNARTVAEHNLKELKQIAPIAYLPKNIGTPQTGSPYDADDIKRLNYKATKTYKDVQNGYQALADKLKNKLNQIDNDVLSRFQENPDSDKRWIFIGEGRKDQAMKLFDESLPIAQSSIYLETALGREAKQALTMVEKINAAKEDFIQKMEIALNTSKLPEPKSNDKRLLAIAKQILEKPKYEFGKHAKIIITSSEVIERERKDSELKIDDTQVTLGGDIKMSGTETTWTYKWKEFKFSTALKETKNDDWYIWWITAKNFSSGGLRTPLNQWVSGKASKGNLILEKNISH